MMLLQGCPRLCLEQNNYQPKVKDQNLLGLPLTSLSNVNQTVKTTKLNTNLGAVMLATELNFVHPTIFILQKFIKILLYLLLQ